MSVGAGGERACDECTQGIGGEGLGARGGRCVKEGKERV